MKSSEINDYPSVNAIEQKSLKDSPIIRCENCYEILRINANFDKNEIELKCEKEGKTKNIPIAQFFENLKKYEEINCCQFCKKKNKSQKYYLCKTCSNKILCNDCFKTHSKTDDIIIFKIDSVCRKHYNPYESYCSICKENKCQYCSLEHDESHEENVIHLKEKLFKKKKLDEFKNNIIKITSEKNGIEQKINQVIKELEEKTEFIKGLKKKFLECFDMKINLINLTFSNYEKKLEDFDMNYFIINNLENQINFTLLKLDFDNNDSLDNKIESIAHYINKNISKYFSSDKKEKIEEEKKQENFVDSDIINYGYEKVKRFKYNFIGFLDLNRNLFAFYSSDSIYFITKEKYEIKFQTDKYIFKNIKTCKKINDKKILLLTDKKIYTIKIIENNDYAIEQEIEFFKDIYDFNSNLDLLYLDYDYSFRSYFCDSIRGFSIELASFPNYNKRKSLTFIKTTNKYDYNDKIQWIDLSSFFHFSCNIIGYFKVKKDKCYLEKSSKVSIDLKNISILDLNKDFYCLNNKNNLILLDKSNLAPVKVINLIADNLEVLKISEKFVSVIITDNKSLYYINYDIESNGTKWSIIKIKNLLDENVTKVCRVKDYILCINKDYYNSYFCDSDRCTLFKVIDEDIDTDTNNRTIKLWDLILLGILILFIAYIIC